MKTINDPTKQGELFIDYRFFVFLSGLITNGTVAKIKPQSLAVLLVLRCFASYNNGLVRNVSHQTIAKFAGISRHSVIRSIDVLESNGLIHRSKDSGSACDCYRIFDKISVYKESNEEQNKIAELNIQYKPRKTSTVLDALKHFVQSGQLGKDAKDSGITINFNINVTNTTNNINDAGTVSISIGNTNSTGNGIESLRDIPDGPMKQMALKVLTMLPDEAD